MVGAASDVLGLFELDEVAIRAGTRHIEVLRERNRQRTASYIAEDSPERSFSLGIVGAGVMGKAVAAAAVASGIRVIITDVDDGVVRDAEEAIFRLVRSDYPQRPMMRGLKVTKGLDAVAACEVVIETVVEDEQKKRSLLRDLDERMRSDSLLATNTSTIPIGRLRLALRNPERFCGTHFFPTVAERPVVELIFWEGTSKQARTAAVGLVTALGREALLAPDAVGFVVNRLMMPYVCEAMQLLTEGVAPELIDDVAVRFGMAKGPLALLDEIGLDTALDCGWVFAGAHEERIAVSPLLVSMVKAGRLGQKSGAGFFRHETTEGGRLEHHADPQAAEIVGRWAKPAAEISCDEIATRLFLPMVFEGTRILEEHEDCLAADVDLGAVLGLGMSASRGGPLFWVDWVGAEQILQMAGRLKSHGQRMEPPASLQRMAHRYRTFFEHETRKP